MEDSKLQEAQDFLKKAEKSTKKSWFSSPDYSIAAQYYEQAANCYKSIKYNKPALETYNLAGKYYLEINNYFMAGKCYEQSSSLALNLQDYEVAYRHLMTSSDYYKLSGSMDIAAQLLEKYAKIFEPIEVEKAIELLKLACEIYVSEEKGKFSIESYRKWQSLLIREKNWIEADKVLKEMKQITNNLTNPSTSNKIILSLFVIWLAYGDSIASKKIIDWGNSENGFIGSSEYEMIQSLLCYYEDSNQEEWLNCINKNAILFLDNEIAKVAKRLKLPGTSTVKLPIKDQPTTTLSSNEPKPGDIPPSNEKQKQEIIESDDDSLC
ncbi:TPR-like protein [Neoconidiobolus thromboides FSU 785]|nr:TPR-like protein [Neoconidiobolus thromboides FSU 785]